MTWVLTTCGINGCIKQHGVSRVPASPARLGLVSPREDTQAEPEQRELFVTGTASAVEVGRSNPTRRATPV